MTQLLRFPVGTRFVDCRGTPVSISPEQLCLDWSSPEPSPVDYKAIRHARAIDEAAFRQLVALRRVSSLLAKFEQFRPRSEEDLRSFPFASVAQAPQP